MKRFFSYLRNKPEKTRRRILYCTLVTIMMIIVVFWIFDISKRPWGSLDIPFQDLTSLPRPSEIDVAEKFITSPPHDSTFAISEEFTME